MILTRRLDIFFLKKKIVFEKTHLQKISKNLQFSWTNTFLKQKIGKKNVMDKRVDIRNVIFELLETNHTNVSNTCTFLFFLLFPPFYSSFSKV